MLKPLIDGVEEDGEQAEAAARALTAARQAMRPLSQARRVVLSHTPTRPPRWQPGAGAPSKRQLSEAYATKSAHAPGVSASRGPATFLESRTWTARGAIAISTQESPSGPSL
ncbi:hypothetical protein ADK58_12280 [Streptomyces sp. XY152]|nr:hypothetical protein ADK58_12280 [Streptomyces sp. XY152]